MTRRVMLSAIGALLLVLYPSAVQEAQTRQPGAQTERAVTEERAEGRPVLWEEPANLESRDLFYGIGGKKGEPDPSARYVLSLIHI